MSIITFLQSFIATRRKDDKGAAMVEYGILIAGIAVLVMAAVFLLGARSTASSTTSSTQLDALTFAGTGGSGRPTTPAPAAHDSLTEARRISKMSRIKRDDRGAAMVEFAIVLPVLLLILLGIIEFGRAYNAQVSIQAAAREGARELALGHSPTDVENATRRRRPLGDGRRPSTPDAPARRRATVRRRSRSPRRSRSWSCRSDRSTSQPQESCDAVSDPIPNPPRRRRRGHRLGRHHDGRPARHGRPRHRRRPALRRAPRAPERRRRRRPGRGPGLRRRRLPRRDDHGRALTPTRTPTTSRPRSTRSADQAPGSPHAPHPRRMSPPPTGSASPPSRPPTTRSTSSSPRSSAMTKERSTPPQ